MQRELGAGHGVIEEGLNGRTTVFDDPIEPDRRGADYLPPCLRSHAPLDLLIIALGCNDLKARFCALAGRHRQRRRAADPDGARRTGRAARRAADDHPRRAAAARRLSEFAEMFSGGTEKSKLLAARYREVAKRNAVGFVDAGRVHRLLRPRRHSLRGRPARDPRPRHGGGGAHGPRLSAAETETTHAAKR